MSIWYILWLLWLFKHFVDFLEYVYPSFGMLRQGKSGNPVHTQGKYLHKW
jgi:hypothetical protein